jgi:hypothetical protein
MMIDKIKDLQEKHKRKINFELDLFSVKLIKIIGFIAMIIGIAIIIAFWLWVFKWLFTKH